MSCSATWIIGIVNLSAFAVRIFTHTQAQVTSDDRGTFGYSHKVVFVSFSTKSCIVARWMWSGYTRENKKGARKYDQGHSDFHRSTSGWYTFAFAIQMRYLLNSWTRSSSIWFHRFRVVLVVMCPCQLIDPFVSQCVALSLWKVNQLVIKLSRGPPLSPHVDLLLRE